MTPTELRQALNGEVAYWRRCIPGTDTSRKAAQAIVRALAAHVWLHDQVPFDVLGMVRREAQGLSPVEH